MDAAVFLDRDNTLIANDGDLGDPAHVRLLDGVADGLRALSGAGYRLIVVTNQGGVARGRFTEDDVDAVHQRIAALVEEAAAAPDLINRFYYCPYHPEASVEEYRRDHPWRKPNPGMLLQAARDLDLDLGRSWMIGDQPRDIAAGRAAGCRTVLLNHGAAPDEAEPTLEVATFGEAVQAILRDRPRPARRSSVRPDRTAPTDDALRQLRGSVLELIQELRTEREQRRDFGAARIAAGMCQLGAILLVVLALLQLGSTEQFVTWMLGALMAQLLTVAALLLDAKG